MTLTVPTVEPTELTAGDYLQFDRTLSDYLPSDGWSLSYVLTGAAASVISIAASTSSDGDYFEVRVPSATTANYTAGRYNLIGFVTHTDDRRFEIYRAALVVHPDPATATPELSYAERMLTIVEDKISTRLSADIKEYTLEQMEVQREELAELNRQRERFKEAVRRERGGPFFKEVKASFGRAS